MQFQARYREPIAAGEVTLTFRRWARPQVVAGRRYRTAAGWLEVDAVDVVDPTDITDADARAAGHPDAAAARAALAEGPDRTIYRVRFHPVDEPDPRDVLAAADDLTDDDRAEIDRRLDRYDRASTHGPWTRETLALIGRRPGVRAADLAAEVGRERDRFKIDVRKLKALGLTVSLDVGYRLSPRGSAYVGGA